MFFYLNIKSVIVWRIFGVGGFVHKYISNNRFIAYPFTAIKLFLIGDWKTLAAKLNKRMLPPIKNAFYRIYLRIFFVKNTKESSNIHKY